MLFSGVDFSGIRVLHTSFDKPVSPVTCIVNGANFLAESAVAPGQLLTIFGRDLGPDAGVAFDNTKQLPFAAEGTEVSVGGLAAPLLYVTASQINAIVPYGIKPGAQVPIEIRRNGGVVYTWTMDTVATNPTALLRFGVDGALIPDDQTKPVVPLANAVNEDGTPNSKDNPAQAGSIVTVYATGYGQFTPALADGAPGTTVPASTTGNSIQSWSGTLRPLSVSTIPGWTNAVAAGEVPGPQRGTGRCRPGLPSGTAGERPEYSGNLYLRNAMNDWLCELGQNNRVFGPCSPQSGSFSPARTRLFSNSD